MITSEDLRDGREELEVRGERSDVLAVGWNRGFAFVSDAVAGWTTGENTEPMSSRSSFLSSCEIKELFRCTRIHRYARQDHKRSSTLFAHLFPTDA